MTSYVRVMNNFIYSGYLWTKSNLMYNGISLIINDVSEGENIKLIWSFKGLLLKIQYVLFSFLLGQNTTKMEPKFMSECHWPDASHITLVYRIHESMTNALIALNTSSDLCILSCHVFIIEEIINVRRNKKETLMKALNIWVLY